MGEKKDGLARLISLDFLRGFSIFLMLMVHFVMRVYDQSWMDDSSQLATKSLLTGFFIFQAAFFGAWAGFFLLISSVTNMISISRKIAKTNNPSAVYLKQVLNGFLLLVFAMLIESITGYKGYIGEKIFDSSVNINDYLYRAYHFETIHAIAWCNILNAITHALLTKWHGRQNIKKIIISYCILAFFIFILTPLMWKLADLILPGYPSAKYPDSKIRVQYPLIGQSTFFDYILLFFLDPIAGVPEPIFPFLSLSYIGSVIGLLLFSAKDHPRWILKGLRSSFSVMILGFLGTVIYIAIGLQNPTKLLKFAYRLEKLTCWAWWYLFIAAIEVFVLLSAIYLIELKSNKEKFAKGSRWIRRFGIIPLSIYNYQYLDYIPRWFISMIFNIDLLTQPFSGPLFGLFLLIDLVFWIFFIYLWEKLYYIGSFEWIIALLSKKSTKAPKEATVRDISMQISFKENQTFLSKLDVLKIKGRFYSNNWLLLEDSEVHIDDSELPKEHLEREKENSILLFFSWVSFISIVYGIIMLVWIQIQKKKSHLNRKLIKKLSKLNWSSFILWIVVFVILMVIPLSIFF